MADILDYKSSLYLSTNSAKSSNYLWLTEIDIISAIIIKSRWFNVLNGFYLQRFIFNIVMISEDFLFTLQDSIIIKSSTASIIVFDKKTFTPLKKFDFNYQISTIISYFYIRQKYYIIGAYEKQVQVLTLDNLLKSTSFSKTFESSRVSRLIDTINVVLFNNTFIISESGPMNGIQNSTISNIIFHKASQDFKSNSWESFESYNGVAFVLEMLADNSSTGYIFRSSDISSYFLNNTDLALTYVYFKSKVISYYFFRCDFEFGE